jgi:hypothetical protein
MQRIECCANQVIDVAAMMLTTEASVTDVPEKKTPPEIPSPDIEY